MLRYSLYHHSPQAMRNTLYYRPLQRLDSPTDRKNPLVQSLLSGQILPVTGTFFPQTCLQKSRFFQPLEESSRSKPAQRPKTSSQWRNHPAYRPLCVLILTSTGGIRTQKAIDLTVRMDFHGTRMRSCGVHRRGSGGTFALGRTAWGASRCAAGGGPKAFSESSVPICDTRGRSGPKVSKRRVPGGNRQSEGIKAKPRKPNVFNGFRGSNPGGGYEIRTREAVTPTRFPSVRHRPLGESSITLFAAAFWPQQTTRREYHRLADKQNRRVLCVCRAWRLARPGSLRRSDARIQ